VEYYNGEDFLTMKAVTYHHLADGSKTTEKIKEPKIRLAD
jgi:hypothetical protein